ncbi:hypothetical protein [Salinisphaera orenii]|uniref:hypothetical protein n=1 Tax=Salinisphaera orenii TaxID=856731 RepID=UPI000DBE6E8B
MSRSRPSPVGAIVLFASAVIGVVIALYGYLAPLTGITGSLGALLVVVTSALLALMAIVLASLRGRVTRSIWRVLILFALAGTCFAALLLHEWWLCAAMGAGLIGLILDLAAPGDRGAIYS